MDISKKVRLLVNAMYTSGVSMFDNKLVVADAEISKAKPDTDIRIVSLRFAAPSGVAQELLHAFKTGDVELLMAGVTPAEA